jgi:hypothetical protein
LQRKWLFPWFNNHKGQELHRIFNKHRCNADGEHDKLRASASELLGVYFLVRHWVETEVVPHLADGELTGEVASFREGCTAVDIILAAKKKLLPMPTAADELRKTVSKWMQLHKACYGEAHMVPKHHWMFDIADQLEIDEMVFDQLIIERLHLTVKPHAQRVDNLSIFEASVGKGVLIDQLEGVKSLRLQCTLGDARHSYRRPGTDATFNVQMHINGMHLHEGDVVFYGERAGVIVTCAQEGIRFYAIVKELVLNRATTNRCCNCSRSRKQLVWPAIELEQEHFFYKVDSLIPLCARPVLDVCFHEHMSCMHASHGGMVARTERYQTRRHHRHRHRHHRHQHRHNHRHITTVATIATILHSLLLPASQSPPSFDKIANALRVKNATPGVGMDRAS